MMNTHNQLVSFDQTVNQHLSSEDIYELAAYLIATLNNSDFVCASRKYTLQNILISNFEIFKHVFLGLNQSQQPFFGVQTLKDIIPLQVQDKLTKLFNHKIAAPETRFSRKDGRRRLFINSDQLDAVELSIFEKITESLTPVQDNMSLEKVLFEQISPIDQLGIDTSFWHIDALRDQIKVVIPINHMHANNAPMRYIDKIASLENYNLGIWQKLHTIYKISGLSVSKANYFEDYQIVSMPICSTQAKTGDVIVFNPQVIHSGSLCKQGHRQTITLYYDVKSNRNLCLQKIH